MSAKVVLKFDVTPAEKEEFEALCKALGVTKIDFLRTAIAEALEAHPLIKKQLTK